nr:hypothetical protein [Sphingomonas sp. Y57]
MTDRPIIFSGPMVRALLDGRKTQTRRLASSPLRRCQVGDRLYVREHWKVPTAYDDLAPSDLGGEEAVRYLADGAIANLWGGDRTTLFGKHRQGMHMPRWASRLMLIVEDVRFQRLQEISEADAIAEGLFWQEPADEDRQWVIDRMEDGEGDGTIRGVWIVPGTDCGFGPKPRCPLWGPTPASCYRGLWQSLHTADGERWESNPEIVALTFRVIHQNIDRIAA